jgi:hypothetical protein
VVAVFTGKGPYFRESEASKERAAKKAHRVDGRKESSRSVQPVFGRHDRGLREILQAKLTFSVKFEHD